MAQFVVIPPLERITDVFISMTGQPLIDGASWKQWRPMVVGELMWLNGYVRPCHRAVLHKTITGAYRTPLVLLRQLLRPHEYYIDTIGGGGGWRVRRGKPMKHVEVHEGTTVEWNS